MATGLLPHEVSPVVRVVYSTSKETTARTDLSTICSPTLYPFAERQEICQLERMKLPRPILGLCRTNGEKPRREGWSGEPQIRIRTPKPPKIRFPHVRKIVSSVPVTNRKHFSNRALHAAGHLASKMEPSRSFNHYGGYSRHLDGSRRYQHS